MLGVVETYTDDVGWPGQGGADSVIRNFQLRERGEVSARHLRDSAALELAPVPIRDQMVDEDRLALRDHYSGFFLAFSAETGKLHRILLL